MRNDPQGDRRVVPRSQVVSSISISIGRVTPAFQPEAEHEEDTSRYMGLVYDISDRGMCITTQDPLPGCSFVDISVIRDPENIMREKYSGVIIWDSERNDDKNYRYGIEFVSSWIRRKVYRKYK